METIVVVGPVDGLHYLAYATPQKIFYLATSPFVSKELACITAEQMTRARIANQIAVA